MNLLVNLALGLLLLLSFVSVSSGLDYCEDTFHYCDGYGEICCDNSICCQKDNYKCCSDTYSYDTGCCLRDFETVTYSMSSGIIAVIVISSLVGITCVGVCICIAVSASQRPKMTVNPQHVHYVERAGPPQQLAVPPQYTNQPPPPANYQQTGQSTLAPATA